MVPIQNDAQFIQWLRGNALISTIRKEFIAGVPIQAGMGVYIGTDGKVYPYTTAHQNAYIGIAENNSAINCVFTVVIQGYLKVPSLNWTSGTIYSIQNGGSLGATGDFKVAIGVGDKEILIYNQLNFGGSSTTTDGYAKVLMLMGA